MPVREQLRQLRRRLHNRAEEVKAAKAAVERETLADAASIVERLRSVEALKQVKSCTRAASEICTKTIIVCSSCSIMGFLVRCDQNRLRNPTASYGDIAAA